MQKYIHIIASSKSGYSDCNIKIKEHQAENFLTDLRERFLKQHNESNRVLDVLKVKMEVIENV